MAKTKKAAPAKAASAKTPAKAATKNPDALLPPAPATGAGEDVVVKGRPLNESAAKGKAVVLEPDVTDEAKLKGTSFVTVTATDKGYYGHKLREKGEVFEMRVGKGDLPGWVEKATKDDEKRPVPGVPRRKDDKDVVNDLLNNAGLDAAGNEKVDDDDQVL